MRSPAFARAMVCAIDAPFGDASTVRCAGTGAAQHRTMKSDLARIPSHDRIGRAHWWVKNAIAPLRRFCCTNERSRMVRIDDPDVAHITSWQVRDVLLHALDRVEGQRLTSPRNNFRAETRIADEHAAFG